MRPLRCFCQSLWLLLFILMLPGTAASQTCFDYADGCSRPGWVLPSPHPSCVNALVPIRCVEQGDLNTPCSWDGDCHDVDPASCCTTVPAAPGTVQTVLEMHDTWHQCFGAVGDSDGDNPPGRGQRWYAFHRQFEFDFNLWREDVGFAPIESLEWCPSMNLPVGHPSGGWPNFGPGSHPNQCGVGTDRPNNTSCRCCRAFPQCLFVSGGGPGACSVGANPEKCSDPGSNPATCCPTTNNIDVLGACEAQDGISFPYDSIDDFPNMEEVSTLLDDYFHGWMHGAVTFADGGAYVDDSNSSDCSPRDPMFWRLHKALDDVVRAWQNVKASDVMLVVDRSGSMSGTDAGSGGSKLDAALDAADAFADLLEHNRSDGQQNRIGIVSYSGGAALQLPLTVADPTLRAPGGPFETALTAIDTAGPGGCTSLGAGIERALEELCPPLGNCQGYIPGPGENARKAVLLLTDGLENRPPCLDPASAIPGGSCGSECHGPRFDENRFEFTQFVGVGFGSSSSLNGSLLTLLAERQGGIYMQNPGGPGDDLKDFFQKAFGNLSDEFLLVDPKGVLAANEAASDIVEYNSCGDDKLTFAGGWNNEITPGDLRLLVTTPAGDLVQPGDPAVEASAERLWSFARTRSADIAGTWQAQLVRQHQIYVNGFAPDAFADPDQGVAIVRRQIQRLCPDGCKNVLLFEGDRKGSVSAYEKALAIETSTGLLASAKRTRRAGEFNRLLQRQRWDLIVYAYMGPDQPQAYDQTLAELLCKGQRAILTDVRKSADGHLFECAGTGHDGNINWTSMDGDGQLFEGTIKLDNPGYPIASYGLKQNLNIQALAARRPAIVARSAEGEEQNWFINILGRSLSQLSPARRQIDWETGEQLVAVTRILPSFLRQGGYDHVDARVEVTYPTIGVGSMITERWERQEVKMAGEILDGRAAALEGVVIPTKTITFPLYDDGTHGDLYPGNAYWSGKLSGLGTVDGTYKLRFIFDLTADGCTTHRELVDSLFVEVAADPPSSDVRVGKPKPLDQGGWRTPVDIHPQDRYGNLWGPGRAGLPSCGDRSECQIDPKLIVDHRNGSYTLALDTAPGVASVRLEAFGTRFDLDLPCADCPRLLAFKVDQNRVREHSEIKAVLTLDSPASDVGKGVRVLLSSSNSKVAAVPGSVLIPAGKSSIGFPINIAHSHDGPGRVVLTASYGGDRQTARLEVTPLKRMIGVRTDVEPKTPEKVFDPKYMHKGHQDPGQN